MLAVHGNGEGFVVRRREGNGIDPRTVVGVVDASGWIQLSVGEIPIVVWPRIGVIITADDNLAVVTQRQVVRDFACNIECPRDVGEGFAVAVEGGIDRAVDVVANDHELGNFGVVLR